MSKLLLSLSLIIIMPLSVVHASTDVQDEEIQDVDCTNPQDSEERAGCDAAE